MGAEKILVAEGRAVNTSDRAPAAARNKTEDREEYIKHHKLEKLVCWDHGCWERGCSGSHS